MAFGALGTPVITLAKVHGYDLMEVSAMIGRQLPFFSLLVPFWLIWAFAGRKGMWDIWPAILVTGLSFAIPQFLVSNFIGPELVDIIAALVSMICLVAFLRVWKPREVWTSPSLRGHDVSAHEAKPPRPLVQHPRCRAGARLDAMGHPHCVRLHLGPAAGEELPQRPVRAHVPDRRPAQPDR